MKRRPLVSLATLASIAALVLAASACSSSSTSGRTVSSTTGSVTTSSLSPGGQADGSLQSSSEAAVQSQFEAEFGSGPFAVAQIKVTTDAKAIRVLLADLRVPSVADANQTISQVMAWFEITISSLNRDKQANLDVLHVVIMTLSGENVVDWTENYAGDRSTSATGHWAPGITNYWFPVPDTTASSTTSIPPTTSTSTVVDRERAVARAIGQIEAALDLPKGAVTQSSEGRMLPGADVMLAWAGGGRAGLDLHTDRILTILSGDVTKGMGEMLSAAELDKAAIRMAQVLGWDSATLAAEGFTPLETQIIPHGDAPTEYSKRWQGHDEQGVPNNGLIDVALEVTTGKLLHFFYFQGVRAGGDTSRALSRDDAVRIAKDYIGDQAQVPTTMPTGGSPTTLPLGVLLRSAELIHTKAPGITGGKDMLVWIVKLGGSTATGEVRATIYIDAVTGEVLTWLVF